MGIVGPLLTLVRYSHADEAWVRYLLFDVLVVDRLQTAARLHREGFQGKLVTLDGQALLADGAVVGGATDESATHLLRLKREIRELEEAAASEGADLERATARQGQLRVNIAERQAAIDSARVEAHDAELEILGAERDLRVVEMELRRIDERRQEIAHAEAEGRASLSQVDVDESNTKRQLADALRDVANADEANQVAASVLGERRRVLEELQRLKLARRSPANARTASAPCWRSSTGRSPSSTHVRTGCATTLPSPTAIKAKRPDVSSCTAGA